MRKIVIVVAAALGIASVPLAAGALTSSSASPAETACVTVNGNVQGNQVDRDVCAPTSEVPTPPTVPSPPIPPPTPPLPTPPLPAPPSVPTPPVPTPPVPVPPLPVAQAQAADAGCHFTSARPDPPPAGETTYPLPDGGVIYQYGDPTTLTGYAGGTGPHGTLEGSGNGPGTGYFGGHSNDAPLDGYITTTGICINGTSIP